MTQFSCQLLAMIITATTQTHSNENQWIESNNFESKISKSSVKYEFMIENDARRTSCAIMCVDLLLPFLSTEIRQSSAIHSFDFRISINDNPNLYDRTINSIDREKRKKSSNLMLKLPKQLRRSNQFLFPLKKKCDFWCGENVSIRHAYSHSKPYETLRPIEDYKPKTEKRKKRLKTDFEMIFDVWFESLANFARPNFLCFFILCCFP